MSESCIADMLLAVSEACSNAVRHGGPANRYEVSASIGYGRCDVRVADNGGGLPSMPLRFPPPRHRERPRPAHHALGGRRDLLRHHAGPGHDGPPAQAARLGGRRARPLPRARRGLIIITA
ncbi:ATP-binding protein [Nonomuraea ferruginea]